MVRLFKLCVAMAAFVAFAWFGTTVKLGPRTLFQHLRAIGQTQESRELVDGTRQAAEPLVEGVKRRLAGAAASETAPEPDVEKSSETAKAPGPAPEAGPAPRAPRERVSPADKRQLRKVIAEAKSHSEP